MVRPRRAYGRPGTAVLPASWAAEHGLVANGFDSATVTIRRPGGTPTTTDGVTTTAPHSPFAEDVPAAIKAIDTGRSAGPDVEVAGDLVKVTGYLVSLPRSFTGSDSAFLAESSIVEVVTCDDVLLVGRTLVINDVVRATDRMTRDLIVTLND